MGSYGGTAGMSVKPPRRNTCLPVCLRRQRGGQLLVRLKKGLASRAWENLVLAIIGEQFDVGNEICGAVVSVRYR